MHANGRSRPHAATHSGSPRWLRLVDLDNLVGGPTHHGRVAQALRAFARLAPGRTGDHLVIAAERVLLRAVAFELPPDARLLIGTGPDGADRRLLEEYPADFVARRYDGLVIGSGDGCFVDLAVTLGSVGVPVQVVANPDTTARRLRLAADRFTPMHPGRDSRRRRADHAAFHEAGPQRQVPH